MRNAHRDVLTVLAQAIEPDLSWYSIANRLGRRGVIVDVDARQLLRKLVAQGLIERRDISEPPFTRYAITAAGIAAVSDDMPR